MRFGSCGRNRGCGGILKGKVDAPVAGYHRGFSTSSSPNGKISESSRPSRGMPRTLAETSVMRGVGEAAAGGEGAGATAPPEATARWRFSADRQQRSEKFPHPPPEGPAGGQPNHRCETRQTGRRGIQFGSGGGGDGSCRRLGAAAKITAVPAADALKFPDALVPCAAAAASCGAAAKKCRLQAESRRWRDDQRRPRRQSLSGWPGRLFIGRVHPAVAVEIVGIGEAAPARMTANVAGIGRSSHIHRRRCPIRCPRRRAAGKISRRAPGQVKCPTAVSIAGLPGASWKLAADELTKSCAGVATKGMRIGAGVRLPLRKGFRDLRIIAHNPG